MTGLKDSMHRVDEYRQASAPERNGVERLMGTPPGRLTTATDHLVGRSSVVADHGIIQVSAQDGNHASS